MIDPNIVNQETMDIILGKIAQKYLPRAYEN